MTRQLALSLPFDAARGREDFHPAPSNALALAAVDGWRDWPQGKLVLVGPAGSGKTHLACIWALEAHACRLAAADLVAADLPTLAAHGRVAVEDCEVLAGNPDGERALLHLHNLLAETPKARLLVSARTPPRDWGLALPDLASRLQAAPLARIEAPGDALLSAVLVKLFSDRKTPVAPTAIPYLVTRMDRSLAAAHDLVARLDALALAQRRPVSRTMAARALGSPPDDDTGQPA